MKDLYAVLGADKSDSIDEIRKKYHKAALACHPDKAGSNPSTDAFVVINEAYETLSDPTKRSNYDEEYSQWLGAETFTSALSGLGDGVPTDSGVPFEFLGNTLPNLFDILRHTSDKVHTESRSKPRGGDPLLDQFTMQHDAIEKRKKRMAQLWDDLFTDKKVRTEGGSSPTATRPRFSFDTHSRPSTRESSSRPASRDTSTANNRFSRPSTRERSTGGSRPSTRESERPNTRSKGDPTPSVLSQFKEQQHKERSSAGGGNSGGGSGGVPEEATRADFGLPPRPQTRTYAHHHSSPAVFGIRRPAGSARGERNTAVQSTAAASFSLHRPSSAALLGDDDVFSAASSLHMNLENSSSNVNGKKPTAMHRDRDQDGDIPSQNLGSLYSMSNFKPLYDCDDETGNDFEDEDLDSTSNSSENIFPPAFPSDSHQVENTLESSCSEKTTSSKCTTLPPTVPTISENNSGNPGNFEYPNNTRNVTITNNSNSSNINPNLATTTTTSTLNHPFRTPNHVNTTMYSNTISSIPSLRPKSSSVGLSHKRAGNGTRPATPLITNLSGITRHNFRKGRTVAVSGFLDGDSNNHVSNNTCHVHSGPNTGDSQIKYTVRPNTPSSSHIYTQRASTTPAGTAGSNLGTLGKSSLNKKHTKLSHLPRPASSSLPLGYNIHTHALGVGVKA